MHRILVDEKRWIDEERFLHALNYCMLLPGPEAQQLATYVGWLLHRAKGGLAAGFGIKAAVFAVVAQAVLKIGRRALRSRAMYAIAAASLVGIFLFDVPFPAIVVAAGMLGLLVRHVRASKVTVVCLPLWWLPVGAFAILLGTNSVYVQEGLFFSEAAVVTFGGAYAVLAYIAQQAVDTYHWLEPGEMLDGLGLAETTPGPLIMVVQFVGFLAPCGHDRHERHSAATDALRLR